MEGGNMMTSKIDVILKSIEESSKMIRILPKQDEKLLCIEKQYSINKESALGAIVYNTGGIIIEGWIRIYGAGELDFAERNQLFPYDEIVVGEDILGGLFIILAGGNVAYFAPDTLEIEDMDISLGQFIYWCLQGDTDTFYMDYRWEDWQKDVEILDLSQGMSFYPYLWAASDSFEKRYRKPIPMKELIGLEIDFLQQIGK
jgi:hypothetical protein